MPVTHIDPNDASVSSRQTNRDIAPILIAEDELRWGNDLVEEIESDGIPVAGPVPTTVAALAIVGHHRPLEAAVLDVNLADALVFPVADRLTALQVPFVFMTAAPDIEWPTRFASVPKFGKPVGWRELRQALFPARRRPLEYRDRSFRRELDAALPRLRYLAKELAQSGHLGDDLVEQTLTEATAHIQGRPRDIAVGDWLCDLMVRIAARRPWPLN